MNDYSPYLNLAEKAAREAGAFLREHLHYPQMVDESLAHDIKLRVDKDTQTLIAARLLGEAPETSLLGEEGCCGASAELQWVVDPLDGTVNYYYGIPIFCTSIALHAGGVPVLGCVYDPMQDECYTALCGEAAFCNGRRIAVSERTRLSEAVVFVGHGSHDGSGEAGLRRFAAISQQVRKMRILGSAALSLCYIAAGRFDAYVESRICLWDFAAARVILEAAGGCLEFTPSTPDGLRGAVCAWNQHLPLHDVLAAL